MPTLLPTPLELLLPCVLIGGARNRLSERETDHASKDRCLDAERLTPARTDRVLGVDWDDGLATRKGNLGRE